MAGGASDIGGGSGGSGRRRGKRAAEKGKEKVASTSATPTSIVTSKDPTPATDPSLFVPQDKARQDKLQREKPVWKYAKLGQEAGEKGRGEYWVRCRLCMQIWRGTNSRAVEHYLKTQKPCPSHTGEMVNERVKFGEKVLSGDKNMRYLRKNYRHLQGIPEGGVDQTEKVDEVVEVPAYLEPQPPPTAGRAAPPCDAGDLHKENTLEAAVGEASGSNTRLSSLQQSTIKRWVDNDAQKKLDIAWAKAMFHAGIPFNFLNFDTNQKLHELYMQVAKSRPEVKLPSFNHMRTVMLDIVYMRVQKTVEPLTTCWDVSGYVDKRTPSEWWAAHGGDVPELQKVAIKVMGMWSTASAAERNWASMDFIHSKRRNKLSPERLAKLVYIHWNMQLLRVPETKNNGFVYLWCAFIEPAPEPEENGGSVSKGPEDEAEKAEEELVRERRLTKTPKGRVQKNLEDKDEELTDDSDLDDELWKGKCGLSEDSSGSEEDDDDDSAFELRPESSVPGTTYVGRRPTRRQRREEPHLAATELGVRETALYNPQSDVELARLDTDVKTLLETRVDEDEEDANRAKAMADRETELVNKCMMEEEARRAAIPTRREIEIGLKQAREYP
ncbi:hypothetical protein CBR_g36296 [Chara braunii]|uniref:HAT C-terminal dimerisation domain-containing protein n=1 Tax=Chara braunii TaxID=69332 RepID=A0A388LKA9_CHABU|nr:hypothetical protein CBR_g36296 [Chara braunii]|eukprot:GBG82766.1 hypothetical protein CBR_g36296 [Chara braunii]